MMLKKRVRKKNADSPPAMRNVGKRTKLMLPGFLFDAKIRKIERILLEKALN